MEEIFPKTGAVRGRVAMLALLLAMVCAAAIPGVATATEERDYVGVDGVVISLPVSKPVVVAESPSEMPELNITMLRINPDWYAVELMPGEDDEITVTVTNPNNEIVLVDPTIIGEPYSEYVFDEDWITITPASAELRPDGGEEQFTIAVAIPDDADLGHYNVKIAFTDDAEPTPYPEPYLDPYPKYVNTFRLNVEVWKPPVVQILPSRIRDHVESGKGYDYAVTLKNTGNEDIAIDPEMVNVTANIEERDGPVYGEDCVGYFFQPNPDKMTVYQIYVNPLGTVFDQEITFDETMWYTANREWDGEYEVATQRTDDRWSVEIRVPLAQIGGDIGQFPAWGANFRRKQARTSASADWQVPIDYDPNTFGEVAFE